MFIYLFFWLAQSNQDDIDSTINQNDFPIDYFRFNFSEKTSTLNFQVRHDFLMANFYLKNTLRLLFINFKINLELLLLKERKNT